MRQRIAELEASETEHKRAEEVLKKSEEHLRNVLDGLGPYMLVGLMTPEGTLVEANRPALEIAGLKPEDVLGKSFEETYWWSYSEPVKQQLRDAIRRAARGEPCRYDVVMRVGEDRFITIDFCLQPLVGETGKIIYLIPSAVDISERKRAEKALWESEKRYRLLADNAADAIWVVDVNMRPSYISPSITRLLGYSVEEAMAKPMEEVFTPASFEVAMKALAEELDIEKMEQKNLFRSRVLELELKRKDGSIVPAEIGYSFLRPTVIFCL